MPTTLRPTAGEITCPAPEYSCVLRGYMLSFPQTMLGKLRHFQQTLPAVTTVLSAARPSTAEPGEAPFGPQMSRGLGMLLAISTGFGFSSTS